MTRPPRYEWIKHVQNMTRANTLSANANHIASALTILYANNGHDEAWPSQLTLAQTTGRSKASVWRALHELEQHGLLEVRRGQTARTSGNVYRFHTP